MRTQADQRTVWRWMSFTLCLAIALPLLAAPQQRPPARQVITPYSDSRLMPQKSTRAELANPEMDYLPGQVIVGFRPGAAPAAMGQAAALVNARVMKNLARIDAQLWKLPDGVTPAEAARRLAASPFRAQIDYAEPNYVVDIADHESRDTYSAELWGMHNVGQMGLYGLPGTKDADIDALEAWSAGKSGSRTVKVAIVDTGVDYTHPDLQGNVAPGYDFVNSDADPMDDNGHGSHVAGTIGALGENSLGVKGVSPLVTIIPVKGLSGGGSGDSATLAQCINYAASQGADIINASWGSSSESKTIKNAISKFKGLFVAAAGNSGSDTPFYPAASAVPNIIAVAATEDKDRIVGWSNFGSWVHIAAPGVAIVSTYPMQWGGYAIMSGTSMAAPHVAGEAAMIKAHVSGMATAADLKARILSSSEPRLAPSDHEDAVTPYHRLPDNRINLAKALGVTPDNITGPGAPSQITDLAMTMAEDGAVTFTWTAPGSSDGSAAYAYDMRARETTGGAPALDASNWYRSSRFAFLPNPGHAGNGESFTTNSLTLIRGRSYDFGIRSVDIDGNLSEIYAIHVDLPGSDYWNSQVAAPYGLYWVNHKYDSGGNPAIAYLDEDPAVGQGGKPVAIARRINGVWEREIVTGSNGAHGNVGLAFSASGRPAVAWGRYISWGQGYGVYVSEKLANGTWKTYEIDTGGSGFIEFEPGTENITAIYAKNGGMMFVRIVNGVVKTESIHRNANGINYRRLAYEPDGTAAVVYSRDANGDGYLDSLAFARRVNGKWQLETVESGVQGYGVYADLAWNPTEGRWAVVHQGPNGKLRFLQRIGPGWTAAEEINGAQGSLTFASDGTALVAHDAPRNGVSNVAATTRTPAGGWGAAQIVEYGNWTAWYISPAARPGGGFTIGYAGGNLRPNGDYNWGVKFAEPK